MPVLAETLASGRFVVTAELNPPKGTDLTEMLGKAEALRGYVDAVNVTDSAGGAMTMSPLAAALRLRERGIEPILQLTASHRNQVAVQSDLLAAWDLGLHNVLCLAGDPPAAGDHKDARPVFDFDAVTMLNAVSALNGGNDVSGNALRGSPSFCAGAAANPGAPSLEKEIQRLEEKAAAGARFFQTQAVFDAETLETFMGRARRLGVPVLAGIIVLKSGNMARRMNQTLPGVTVPETLIEEMDGAQNRAAKSVEIAGRLVAAFRDVCQGVHIMAIGWEDKIPAILRAGGVARDGAKQEKATS